MRSVEKPAAEELCNLWDNPGAITSFKLPLSVNLPGALLKNREGDLAGNQAWFLQPHQNQMFHSKCFWPLLATPCKNSTCQHLILQVLHPLALGIMGAKLKETEGRMRRYLHHPSTSVVGMPVSCSSSRSTRLPVVRWPTSPYWYWRTRLF